MKLFKDTLAVLTFAALLVCVPNVRADEWNKKTIIKIDEAVQLPTIVLQPGTYVFKLVDSPSDRHIVQVFDEGEKRLFTTVLAIPNYRLEPKGKTVFTFWEVPAGEIPAVRAWFYPGDLFGQEFAYPKNRATQVAAYTKTSVATSNAQSMDEMKSMPITSTNENGQTSDLDSNTYVAKTSDPAPVPVFEPTPQAATPQVADPAPVAVPEPQRTPAPIPAKLPHTATQAPLLGLFGLLSLGAFFAVRRFARVR
jgi:hypothetical protein